MALTFDPAGRVIESTASISDLVAFHESLRDWEDSAEAVVHPVTHTWKALGLGGGAYLFGCDLVNGWRLKFPLPGNYIIQGNLNGAIIPVAGVFIERRSSAAYITSTSGGGSGGASADSVWDHPLTGARVPGSAGSMLQDVSARVAGAL